MGTSKISNDKHQNTNNIQCSKSQCSKQYVLRGFDHLNFGHWDLFEICFLMLGVFRDSLMLKCNTAELII